MILTQFQAIGHDLFSRGLVSSSSGNLSIKLGNRLIITRRGCHLGCLEEHDLIETGVSKNDRSTPLASIELPVHRAIYQTTSALAIIHAHPPHTIALSLTKTEVVPNYTEGPATMGRVPVLGWHTEVRPGGLVDVIAQALTERRIVIIHGHGIFATGQLLEEAYNYAAALEESCQIMCLLKSLGAGSSKE